MRIRVLFISLAAAGGQGADLLGAASQCTLGAQADASPGANN
jgi:hypothetical protein